MRVVSRLFSTPWLGVDSVSGPGIAMSGDAARISACATSSLPDACEIYGLAEVRRCRDRSANNDATDCLYRRGKTDAGPIVAAAADGVSVT